MSNFPFLGNLYLRTENKEANINLEDTQATYVGYKIILEN